MECRQGRRYFLLSPKDFEFANKNTLAYLSQTHTDANITWGLLATKQNTVAGGYHIQRYAEYRSREGEWFPKLQGKRV